MMKNNDDAEGGATEKCMAHKKRYELVVNCTPYYT